MVPVVSGNYWGVLSIAERRFRPGWIPVKVLEPVSMEGLTAADVDRVAKETREKMVHELKLLTETRMGQNAIKAAEPYPGLGPAIEVSDSNGGKMKI